jgi:hypothetical protein
MSAAYPTWSVPIVGSREVLILPIFPPYIGGILLWLLDEIFPHIVSPWEHVMVHSSGNKLTVRVPRNVFWDRKVKSWTLPKGVDRNQPDKEWYYFVVRGRKSRAGVVMCRVWRNIEGIIADEGIQALVRERAREVLEC